MAIRMRRGLESELDISKAIPGEWLVSTDTRYVRMCFAPGIVLRIATYEAFEADTKKFIKQMESILSETKTVQEAVERIQSEIEDSVVTVENYVESSKGYSNLSNTYALQSKGYAEEANRYADDAYEEAERAKMYAENASAVTDVQIAKQDRAGIIKGGDNHISEDGTLTLTKRTTDTTLYNSYEGGIKINEIDGKSEQRTTTGAQLLDVKILANNSGLTTNIDSDGIITVEGTISSENKAADLYLYGSWGGDEDLGIRGDVFVSLDGISKVSLYLMHGTSTIATSPNGRITANITDDNYITTIFVRFPTDTSFNTSFKIMLNEGTEPLPWEPYTGGKAAPNPEYPQKIKSVRGKNYLDLRGLPVISDNEGKVTPVYDSKGNLLYAELNGTFTGNFLELKTQYLEAGTYILNGCPSGGSGQYNLRIGYASNDGFLGYDTGNGVEFTLNESTEVRVYINVTPGFIAENLKFYPMIRPASILDDIYVPYGLLRFKASGKNFVPNEWKQGMISVDDGKTVSNNPYWLYTEAYIVIDASKEYMLSADTVNKSRVYMYDGKKNFITSVSVLTASTYGKIIPPQNCKYVRFGYNLNGTAEATTPDMMGNVHWLQLEEGTVATDYEPYKEKSIILSNPITLNGHNGVQDHIVQKDGVWGIERPIVEIPLDGFTQSGFVNEGYRITSLRADIVRYSNALCTHMSLSTTLNQYYDVGDYLSTRDNDGRLKVRFTRAFADFAECRSYMAENGYKFYAIIATPTFEPLPEADQIALNSLVSFDTVTYLSSDSEIEPTFDVEYGTSKVGGYTLEAWNTAENNRIKIEELTTAMLVMNQE